jgi:soluble lytic murein transglycosylase-like protein
MESPLHSESTTVAAPRSSSMAAFSRAAFTRYVSLSVLAVALLFVAQHTQLPESYSVALASRPFSRLIELRPSEPTAPSVYEQEAAMSSKELLDRWDPLVAEAADHFHIPAAWLRAVMQRESGGRTMLDEGLPIVSDAGAMGLMQLMPATYGQMARQYDLGQDPFNPHDSVFAAAGYLRWLHGKYGYPAMFAVYNDGPGNYRDHKRSHSLPAETRNYLKAIAAALGFTGHDAEKALRTAKVQLTRPNGSRIAIDATRVSAVQAALPGEYAPSVHTVIKIGKVRQGVRENVAMVVSQLREHGAAV